MRWFKLLSSWDADDWVQSIKADFGSDGLLWYILCLSIVAEGMDGSKRCSRSVSWQSLKDRLGFYHDKRFLEFCLACEGHVQFSVRLSRTRQIVAICSQSAPDLLSICHRSAFDLLIICCPKLLKYRDETSKKSGRAREQELELDPERDQKLVKPSIQSCQTKLLELPDPVKVVFEAWQAAPGVSHSRRLSGHEGPIRAAIEYLGDPDKVVRVIQRYGHVMVNAEGKYRPVYSWGINDFLSRRGHYNLDRFSRDNWEDEFLAWHSGRVFKTVEQLTEDL